MAQHRRRRRQSRAKARVTEESLLKTEVAHQAFNELTKAGVVDREELLRLLFAIPDASDTRLPLVEGMSDKRLSSLLDRIRDWADTIEKVNKSQFLRPSVLLQLVPETENLHWLTPLNLLCSDPEWAKHSSENFERLPRILRLYADYLRVWTALLTGRRQQNPGLKWSLRGFKPRTILLLKLMKLVEDSTGHPCERQVATLVTAAYQAVGLDKSVSEDGLRKLKENNPWPRWSLYPELFSK
jgi:hypothetical protein